jgi:hypothetical protein
LGKAKAEAQGAHNLIWMAGAAEEMVLEAGFDLITIGNAFHRLKRDAVAARALAWLVPGGGLALVWADPPWRGERPWQQAMAEVLARWTDHLGAGRVPRDWEAVMKKDPHERVLRRAGFWYVGRFDFSAEDAWTLQTLAGFVYSSSSLNRDVLGPHLEVFEAELEERLLSCEPDGNFQASGRFAYELAQKPS